jgi:dCMP deaminase
MRISWQDYFMGMAQLAAKRSTCLRRQVGAVIVVDRRIIATGYNGACKGVRDCLELGCLRDELGIESGTRQEVCRAAHAEQNAIIQCAVHGVSCKGGTLYTTLSPCFICARMIVNAGIVEVRSLEKYTDSAAADLFGEAGIKQYQGREG